MPAIVLAELLVGVQLAPRKQRSHRRAALEALVERVQLIAFGREIAESWARHFAQLARRGSMIPASDLMVAATATHLGYGVLVGERDERHFRRIPGLRVERVRR